MGTRVSAPGQDGRYYPCIIQASKIIAKGVGRVDPNGHHVENENMYSVIFENHTTSELKENEIVGPGFQNISSLKLKPGQKVFITHNGREISGSVICHWPHIDEVQIKVLVNADEHMDLKKKLEEVRLLESRKSARLHDQDQDYSRLADVGAVSVVDAVNRKRQTSHVIDVPTPQSTRKRRPSSPDGTDVMDDCAAAMVLMSLSCSPKSPRLPNYNFDAGLQLSHSWTEFSYPQSPVSSSGASSWNSGKSQQSGPRTPSPPNFIYGLSESAPASFSVMRFSTFVPDEGIDVSEGSSADDFVPRKRRNSTKTVFQCTWPGCGKIISACATMEKHVRTAHLGPSGKENSDLSDHEEEFYYTEIEMGIDSVADAFANIFTSSPPTQSHMDMARPPHEDPECQKQVQNSPQKVIRLSPKSVSSTIKPSGLHRKSRGDSKKCRKVYGMENREMWCTQCKWKKACTRFID